MSGLKRDFNSEAEQIAADRRARVASAVSQQEWLDREETKWIPQKYRVGTFHGEGHAEDAKPDEEQAMAYLIGPDAEEEPQPPANVKVASNQLTAPNKTSGYSIAVGIFGLFLLGSVYFFWDSMHEHSDPHRPMLVPAAGYNGVPYPDPTAAMGDPTIIPQQQQQPLMNNLPMGNTGI
mmetsp:Transcript_42479/g.51536  ORF Transcript_42479/g.51536 Transcript_42479/m.51536 type:complete len:178 (+) Transcript_42479:93-626(+)|eukprot:CAMPEP_0197857506 /NCGR_PEP_ID=MMETSP1438-20131217/30638_1 /TAXON_ID=1461541 /ORGANISM="Pterosperma sp., Strain CCMP1384" /LENGTH=177 /DNA_ID=CAMNT_0043473365 /DNA_START=92 /DNA_END=625 /DNA_ORIENTATION=+